MASIPGRRALGRANSPPGGRIDPDCLPITSFDTWIGSHRDQFVVG